MKLMSNLLTVLALMIGEVSFNNLLINEDVKMEGKSNSVKNNPIVRKIPKMDLDIAAIETSNSSVLVGSRDHSPYSKSGLYVSADNFNFSKLAIEGEMDSCILTKAGITYLADWGRLYKSNNNGKTFDRVSSFKESATCIAIDNNNVIYIGSKNTLYKSTDGIKFDKISSFGDFIIGKIIFSSNNTMYLMIGNALHTYASKSLDGGFNFVIIPNIDYISDIGADSNNNVYILSYILYKSTDNGNNFIKIIESKEYYLLQIAKGRFKDLYLTSTHSLYKLSSDNIFEMIWTFNEWVNMVTYVNNETLWVGTKHGIFKITFE